MDNKKFKLLQSLKGDFIIMSDEDIKPNFSELARIYGMDRNTICCISNAAMSCIRKDMC